MARPGLRSLVACLLAALLVAAARPARAQMNEYEQRYGSTVEVSIDNLLQMPESYLEKAVRTRGQLEMLPSMRGQRYSMRGTFGGHVVITPMPDAADEFEMQAKRWVGR